MTPEEVLAIVAEANAHPMPDRVPDRVRIWVRRDGSDWSEHEVWQVDVKEWRAAGWEVRFRPPPPAPVAVVSEFEPDPEPEPVETEPPEPLEPEPLELEPEPVELEPEPEPEPEPVESEPEVFHVDRADLAELKERWKALNPDRNPPPRAGKPWYKAQLSEE